MSAEAPQRFLYEDLLRRALAEDLGRGDLTTNSIVPSAARGEAEIVARQTGRIAGLETALDAFRILDPGLQASAVIPEGKEMEGGQVLARLEGLARALLGAERVALNLLARLSGIATLTQRYVEAVAHTRARIVDTRKTTPGLRVLEKHAVRCGGGGSHRFGLDDAVLIKDNHLAFAGSLTEAIRRVRATSGHMLRIEVEVDSLQQLDEALALDIDAVLLDNMSLDDLRAAVESTGGRALLEASGGVTLDTVAAIAETGVDLISVGALTHSAISIDVALDWRP